MGQTHKRTCYYFVNKWVFNNYTYSFLKPILLFSKSDFVCTGKDVKFSIIHYNNYNV